MNIQTENKIQKYLEQDKNILKPGHRYTLDEFGLNQKIKVNLRSTCSTMIFNDKINL